MEKHDLSIFLCGDVMTGRGIDQLLPHPAPPHIYEPYLKDARGYLKLAEMVHGAIEKPVPYRYIWGDALAVLDAVAPEVRLVNLETSITTSEEYWPGKGINYRMHPENFPCLSAAKIDACALANNHVLDWGYPGLEETVAVLKKGGIKAAGAGADQEEAAAPAILPVPGKGRVIFYSVGFPSSGVPLDWGATAHKGGVNLLPHLGAQGIEKISAQIGAVKKGGDTVIASLHWGGNWGFEIGEEERIFAHRLIDEAGVDLVHGHSSHHVKGIEVYRDRLILYGCGDFINDYEGIRGYADFRGDLGLMYFPSIAPESGRLTSLSMVPTRMKKLQVNLASEGETSWLRDTLNGEGKKLGTRAELTREGTLLLRWR